MRIQFVEIHTRNRSCLKRRRRQSLAYFVITILLIGAVVPAGPILYCREAVDAQTAVLDERVFDTAYDTDEGFAFGSGSGESESEAFLIATPEQLDNVRRYRHPGFESEMLVVLLSGYHFKLICDIDLGSYLAESVSGWEPIGNSTEEDGHFSGVFDGCGYTIYGLWLYRPDASFCGLFGFAENTEIKNLRIELDGRGIQCGSGAGGIIGELHGTAVGRGGASIKNCYVTGEISSLDAVNSLPLMNNAYAGGLAAACSQATIAECWFSGSVSGVSGIGGLVGEAMYVTVKNSGFDGVLESVLPDDYALANAGGIVGRSLGDNTVETCFTSFYGDADRMSAIVGHNSMYSSGETAGVKINEFVYPLFITNCYYNAGIFHGSVTLVAADQSSVDNSFGLSGDALKSRDSYSGYDFDAVWGIDVAGYPGLKCFIGQELLETPKNGWPIVFAVCAGVLAVCAAAFVIFFIQRHRRQPETAAAVDRILLEQPKFPDALTPREREVAGLILEGVTRKEIAGRLYISEHTVKRHIENLLFKTDCSSQKEFIVRFK